MQTTHTFYKSGLIAKLDFLSKNVTALKYYEKLTEDQIKDNIEA